MTMTLPTFPAWGVAIATLGLTRLHRAARGVHGS